jgi:hypothetical protein
MSNPKLCVSEVRWSSNLPAGVHTLTLENVDTGGTLELQVLVESGVETALELPLLARQE